MFALQKWPLWWFQLLEIFNPENFLLSFYSTEAGLLLTKKISFNCQESLSFPLHEELKKCSQLRKWRRKELQICNNEVLFQSPRMMEYVSLRSLPVKIRWSFFFVFMLCPGSFLHLEDWELPFVTLKDNIACLGCHLILDIILPGGLAADLRQLCCCSYLGHVAPGSSPGTGKKTHKKKKINKTKNPKKFVHFWG